MAIKKSGQISVIIFVLFFFMLFHVNVIAQVKDSFSVVGVHPSASKQSTNTGKQLRTLFPWNGKLYSGYGDYGANTGPIDIYSFLPDSLSFNYEAQANTEAIYNYRAINGILYAPAIDRKSYGIPGDYIRMDSNGVWLNYNFGSNSTHNYDAARLNDSTLFMTGSQDYNAAVWMSTNNGKTWKKILTDSAVSGKTDDFARFYFGGILNDKLYVQARDFYGAMHPNSKVFDGSSWTTGPSLFPSSGSLGWKPETFKGKLAYRSWEPGGASQLITFDGNKSSWTGLYVMDCFIHEDFYYSLVDSGFGVKNLRRTADLIKWENLIAIPSNSLSLAIMNDKLFIGTSDSKILQYTKPVSLLQVNTSTTKLNEGILEIQVYPNPANDFILVHFNNTKDPFVTEIVNSLGETIQSNKNLQELDISELSSGIYFLKLNQEKNSIIQKFLKK